MSKRRKTLSEEDHILWEKVKATVRVSPHKETKLRVSPHKETSLLQTLHKEINLQESNRSKSKQAPPKLTPSFDHDKKNKVVGQLQPLPKPFIDIDPHQLFLGKRPPLSQAALSDQSLHNAAVDPATRKRIVKGRMPIDGTFDLHGLTQDQARAALSRFIQTAQSRGDRTIIVVTGKGSSPKSEGILRRMVPLWLRQADLQTYISGFSSAARHHGGDGAFYIRLKKQRK